MQSRAQAAAYIGAGVGVIIFALFGLLPASFLGGAIGLSLAGKIFGHPLASALFPRIIVAVSMAFGTLVFAVATVFICSTLVRLSGFCLGWLFRADRAWAFHLRSKK